MAIQIFDTKTRTKRAYKPVNPAMTGFYVCGPTVYDYFHIGNARPFIVFDVIRRFLMYRGYNVRYVMNLTDIDDKIIKRAQEENVPADVIARRYSQAFFEDIQKLGVLPADVYPRATQHIEDIISLIQRLEKKGVAYTSGGDVFFDVTRFSGYAALSGKKLEELQSGARIAVDENKRNPLDFVLWKAAKPGEPSWESPWGPGRPGWHIECSVMSMKYLGESFDFHAGGQDLIFPHHENERAQAEAATGKEFVRYWLHNGFLDIRGEKMAKSTGNFVTARQLTEKYSATAIRLFFLQKHYRSPIDFSEEGMDAAVVSASRLALSVQHFRAFSAGVDPHTGTAEGELHDTRHREFAGEMDRLHAALIEAMEDDFNTPAALGKVFDLVRVTNKFIEEAAENEASRQLVARAVARFEEYNSFLGIIERQAADVSSERVDRVIRNLLELRAQLRHQKNYALADAIRDRLADAGVVVEDSPQGSSWRWELIKK